MMAQFKSYGFRLPLLAFIVHQILQHLLHVKISFADNYLDPFCLAVFVLYAYRLQQTYFFRQTQLSLLEVGILTLFLFAVTELLFPYLSEQFIADVWDGLAIGFGSIWFVVTAKKIEV